jgi:uncharacterized protein YggE
MRDDAALIRQIREALQQASAYAKAAGDELDRVGTAYVAADRAARTSMRAAVEFALKKSENLSIRAMRLLDPLNKLDGP